MDLMAPLDINANRLARDLGVPVTRISEISHGRCGISADTAMRLERHFGTTAKFWMNIQAAYDLEVAERADRARIEREVPARDAA